MRKVFIGVGLLAWAAAATCGASTLRVPSQYATIQAAVDAAALGDVVLIAPGVYSSPTPIVIDTKKNLRLLGESGKEWTEIHAILLIASSSDVTVAGLTIAGSVVIVCNRGTVVSDCIVESSGTSGIVVSGCPGGAESRVELLRNLIRENAGNGIEAELSGGQARIAGNEIAGNGAAGISILHSYCEISGNLVRGNAGNGITIDQATAAILGNTAAANGGFGMAVLTRGEERTQTIRANVVSLNSAGGIFGDSPGPNSISCNDVWGNPPPAGQDYAGPIGDHTGLDGNISENPLFCDSAGGIFSLAASSPALSQACGTMGSFEQPGCEEPKAVTKSAWGRIKALYRD